MSHVARIAAIEAECSGVWGVSGITSFERERLEEWKRLNSLSPKQEEVLQQIERKAFGDPRE
jgi:hypothetical protein